MGILHIKLFEYLIKKDNAFGYVQIKDFLLANFPELENNNDRLRMKRFLDFMESENYIENMENQQKGISFIQEAGLTVLRNEISSVIRIKPKAVDLYNSYAVNKNNYYGMYISISFAFVALCISAISLSSQYSVDNKSYLNYVLTNKADSLYKEIYILKDSLYQYNIQYEDQKQKDLK